MGLLALLGVLVGLRGISRQIQSNQDRQNQEFNDRDARQKLELWNRRKSAAAAVLAELELQKQLIFQRDLSDEIKVFCTSLENRDEIISIPQSYNSYKSDRVLERTQSFVHELPSWLVTFVVRYLGLLQYTLESYVSVFEHVIADTGKIESWSEEEISGFKRNIETFEILDSRCTSLASILRIMVDAPSEEIFLQKVNDEKMKLIEQRSKNS